MNDEYDLKRFVEAQAAVYDDAISVLRLGRMCTPYMEFIFPRFVSRDQHDTANACAITSLDEASAYLASWAAAIARASARWLGCRARRHTTSSARSTPASSIPR